MKKPRVDVHCVAGKHAATNERIIEIADSQAGCLASIASGEGFLSVTMYRADGTVIVNVPDVPEYNFVPFETVEGVTVTGTRVGRLDATGTFDVTFIGDGKVSVSTHAHVNDDRPAVTCNGKDYLVNHIHLVRNERTGEWSQAPERGRYDITHRSYDDKPIAPTVREAIIRAVVAAAENAWTPERNYQAAIIKAKQRAARARASYVTARDKLRDAGSDLYKAVEEITLLTAPIPESFR